MTVGLFINHSAFGVLSVSFNPPSVSVLDCSHLTSTCACTCKVYCQCRTLDKITAFTWTSGW